MAPINDAETWQKTLAALPVTSVRAGETVVAEGSKTGRLLILKSGAVCIVKGGIEIAKVTEPGAVFGELSALLDQPHTADVLTLEDCEFHVADAERLLADQAALLYVTMILARRLDLANRGLLELKGQIEAGEPPGLIDNTLSGLERLMSAIGTGYLNAGGAYSGYPFA